IPERLTASSCHEEPCVSDLALLTSFVVADRAWNRQRAFRQRDKHAVFPAQPLDIDRIATSLQHTSSILIVYERDLGGHPLRRRRCLRLAGNAQRDRDVLGQEIRIQLRQANAALYSAT